MKFRNITTAALSLSLLCSTVLPARAYSESGSQAEPTGFLSQNCYRSETTGIYETKRDAYINHMGDTLVHAGACTRCEGKTVAPPDSCFEPGDRSELDPSKSSSSSGSSGDYSENFSKPENNQMPQPNYSSDWPNFSF
jgi:hypothetical protein